MDKEDWDRLLGPWASAALARAEKVVGSGPFGGLGEVGATAAELESAEARLGLRLPPSYRGFLQCTNGLRQPEFVTATGGDFLSVENIEWFRVRNQDWIDAYVGLQAFDIPDDVYLVYDEAQDPSQFRFEYLRDCLEISHDGDSAVCLLNPQVIDARGEWEAWFFANWHAGAVRYRSFADLMLAHHASFQDTDSDGF